MIKLCCRKDTIILQLIILGTFVNEFVTFVFGLFIYG